MSRVLRKGALLLVSLSVAFFLGEVLARAFTPHRRGVSWYRYDERYEFRHRSNLDAETTEWGDGLRWRLRTNSRGFRGDEWGPRAKPGIDRILVIGDSFTLGNAVAEAEAFPAVATDVFREQGHPWQALNLGVSAWGPENALGWLESEGADIEASCLIYAFYLGNDMVDHRRSRLFAVRDGRLARRPSDGSRTAVAKARAILRAFPPYDLFIAHSQLFNVVRQVGLATLVRGQSGGAEGGTVGHGSTSPDGAPTAAFALARSIHHTEMVLTHLASVARSRFGCFGVFIVPSRAQLVSRGGAVPGPGQLATESQKALAAWAQRTAEPAYDASAAFPADTSSLAPLFFGRDFHCTAAGNEVLGREFATFARRLMSGRTVGRSLQVPNPGSSPAALHRVETGAVSPPR
jgi:hypothetical protein